MLAPHSVVPPVQSPPNTDNDAGHGKANECKQGKELRFPEWHFRSFWLVLVPLKCSAAEEGLFQSQITRQLGERERRQYKSSYGNKSGGQEEERDQGDYVHGRGLYRRLLCHFLHALRHRLHLEA